MRGHGRMRPAPSDPRTRLDLEPARLAARGRRRVAGDDLHPSGSAVAPKDGSRVSPIRSAARHQILVATTTPALGAGLQTWLSEAGSGWHVAGIAASRAELIAQLKPSIDLVVASACLEGVLVVADVARMGRSVPLPLLVLVSEPDAVVEADLIRAGAMAVLGVKAPREDLVRAATELIGGRAVASAGAMRLLAQIPAPAPTFTERQREILRLVAAGRSTEQIAAELVITPSTVKTHIGRLAARLGLASRQELEARAGELLASAVVSQTTPPSPETPAG